VAHCPRLLRCLEDPSTSFASQQVWAFDPTRCFGDENLTCVLYACAGADSKLPYWPSGVVFRGRCGGARAVALFVLSDPKDASKCEIFNNMSAEAIRKYASLVFSPSADCILPVMVTPLAGTDNADRVMLVSWVFCLRYSFIFLDADCSSTSHRRRIDLLRDHISL